MIMKKIEALANSILDSLFEEEERTGRELVTWVGEREIDGLLYTVYQNKRNGEEYALRQTRTVHMGFNSNEEGKEEEFVSIVEREGSCNALWGVTGRTMHAILAQKLADKFPQYDWEITYNYGCKAIKK
jgi:hypothetical protein